MYDDLTYAQQSQGMRNAVIGQIFGVLGILCFRNGLILLYLKVLGFSSPAIIVCLALPMFFGGTMTIPGAFFADSWGKKRVGYVGQILGGTGFVLMAGAGFFRQSGIVAAAAVTGTVLFAAGDTLMGSGWFGLMRPVVPEEVRGRFWSKLRFSWQTVGIIFSAVCALMLNKNSPVGRFQAVLAVAAVFLFTRILFYRRIPEVRQPVKETGFLQTLAHIIKAPGYASFCCYCFLLLLTVGGLPAIFALLEKEVLNMGDDTVVWLGNIFMIGNLAGFFFIGRVIDRFGTRSVFIVCHLTFAAVLFLFLGRGAVPLPLFPVLAFFHLIFGVAIASSSIAMTTEMMALIPEENQALGTSVCTTLQKAGMGFSGIVGAGILYLGILEDRWSIFGSKLSNYDSILLVCGFAVLMLVVTLGLVPSVIGKKPWGPSST